MAGSMPKRFAVMVALFCMALLPMEAAQAASKWGAIAYSPSSGFAASYLLAPDKAMAESKALTACGKQAKDCVTTISFDSSCGALAVGKKGAWGAGVGANQSLAQAAALAQCKLKDTSCKVKRWQCSQ